MLHRLNTMPNRMNVLNSSSSGSLISRVIALAPAAWYRYNIGITEDTGGVSVWADQSGNSRNLLQGTEANRPDNSAGEIAFNGTSDFMKTAGFTLNDPVTYYMLFKYVFNGGKRFIDGNTLNANIIDMVVSGGNKIRLTGDGGATILLVDAIPDDTYLVLSAVSNGASSVLQTNSNTPATGDTGTGNPGGITMGARADGLLEFSEMTIKEMIVYNAAHDAGTRSAVIAYLNAVGGL